MKYQEVLEEARKNLGDLCKACPVCNGRACKNTMPGPGAKGIGDTAIRNYEKWQEIRLNMDTIYENSEPDTHLSLFGREFRLPVLAGPVGAVKMHYGDRYDDLTYNDIMVRGCREAGILAFCGDGMNTEVMKSACKAIEAADGYGIPTVKPWDLETIREKMHLVNQSGALAVAMDIDAAGLPFLKNCNPPAGAKTVAELREICAMTDRPFILKGIMTVKGAIKAKQAGADAIIVSNHGGRVLDGCPATCEVLEEICRTVGDEMIVLVDGGIRSGMDIFKALALGAKGVVIARPFVTAVYGAAEEGIAVYVERLQAELADIMSMCGAKNLSEITREMIRK